MCGTLETMAEAFLPCFGLDDTVNTMVRLALDRTEADAAVLLWRDNGPFSFRGSAGAFPEDLLGTEATVAHPLLEELGPTRTLVVVEDAQRDPELLRTLGSPDAESLCAMPLAIGKRVRGLLLLVFHRPASLSTAQSRDLNSLVRVAGLSARRSIRFDRTIADRERLEQVRSMLLESESVLMREKEAAHRLAAEVKASRDKIAEAKDYTDGIIRVMADMTADMLLVVDAHGRIKTVNRALQYTLGLESQQLVGQSLTTLVADCELDLTHNGIRQIIDSGGAKTRLQFRTSTEERIPMSFSLAPIQEKRPDTVLVGLARDLRETEQLAAHLDQTFNCAPTAMRVVDRSFHVVTQNSAMQELLGLGPDLEKAEGRACYEVLRNDACFGEDCPVAQLNAGTLSPFDVEVESIRGDGTRVPCRLQASPFYDYSGAATGVMEVFIDVTETKRLTDELRRSNAELDQFAHVASHDLAEPLRKIRFFGDRIKERYAEKLDDRGRDYFRRMVNGAARMQTLIDNLLSYARLSTKAQPFADVDMAAIAREVATDFDLRLQQSGGRIEIDIEHRIEADSSQIRQLLFNLVGNAIKYQAADTPPVVKVTSVVTNGICELEVADNGIGIDEKYLDKIFEVFERLHSRSEYEGTGIGLSICRKIVDRHKGRIWASSQPQVGTTFHVHLPARHNT